MERQAVRRGTRTELTRERRSSAGRGSTETRRERLRIMQLVACLVLFLMVYWGKTAFPNQMGQLRDRLLTAITADTDFRAVFSRVGDSLSEEKSVFSQIEDFCGQAFGPAGVEARQTAAVDPVPDLTAEELRFLSAAPDQAVLTRHYLYLKQPASGRTSGTQPAAAPETAAVPAVGSLVQSAQYSGEALPANYTMDQLSLGGLSTVTPLLGHLTSGYGYREHPIAGVHRFHGGVDIRGSAGDPIRAFAAGVVEYVGQDDSYGLYLQLDHGNGIKSFYAHCQSVCVTKGQAVAAGEVIAAVGSSGAATGPHLHLELKWNRLHLNPAYYVQFTD